MTVFTQKYCIIQILEPREVGAEWLAPDWPLHVTIADVFAVERGVGELTDQLESLLAKQQPFTSVAQDDEQFGEHGQVRVTLLDMNPELVSLHRDVVSLLKNLGAVFNTPEYIEEGFRAHATVRPNARLSRGDTVVFSELAIIDMFPDGNPTRRKVLKKIQLGHQP